MVEVMQAKMTALSSIAAAAGDTPEVSEWYQKVRKSRMYGRFDGPTPMCLGMDLLDDSDPPDKVQSVLWAIEDVWVNLTQ
jgi:hypothetical protein